MIIGQGSEVTSMDTVVVTVSISRKVKHKIFINTTKGKVKIEDTVLFNAKVDIQLLSLVLGMLGTKGVVQV